MDNIDQKNAIYAPSGPVFVLAGPGTGKTYTITHRIHYLIHSLNVLPSQILVFTFTKNAADEMKHRYKAMDSTFGTKVTFGTFHSVFYSYLSKYHYSYLPIISLKEQNDILSMIIRNTKYEGLEFSTLLGTISKEKCKLKKISDTNSLLYQYEELKRSIGKMDFDDILISFYQMISSRNDILQKIQSDISHILIDEFQDINSLQYEIIKLISNGNLYAVGDDAQSIYGFRGSDPTIIQRFLQDYSNTHYYELKVNYRSHAEIMRPAEAFIRKNTELIPKSDQTFYKHNTQGVFSINEFEEGKDQENFIKDTILAEKENSKTCAILVRTNKDVLYYQSLFCENKMQFEHVKAMLYSDIAAYLKFIIHSDWESFYRILNRPIRYLPEYIFYGIHTPANALESAYNIRKYPNLSPFIHHLDMLYKLPPYAFLQYLFIIMGYREFLEQQFETSFRDAIQSFYEELLSLAIPMVRKEELLSYLENHKPRIPTKTMQSDISVMTYHASKGLEFDTVLLPNMNEGHVPGRIAMEEDQLEEERRLFYVAMTRAKNKLFLSFAKKEGSFRLLPSSFLENLYQFSSNSSSSKYSSNLS